MINGQRKITAAMLCGLLGCLCFGSGDWLMIYGDTAHSGALSNPLVFYGVLKLLTLLMPDVPFRLAFTNGLMSESMALWFGSMLVLLLRSKRSCQN